MEKKQPVRVAQIIGDMVDGGVDNFVLNYYTKIDKSKFQFDFIASQLSTDTKKSLIESMGGRVFVIPSYKNVFSYKKALELLFKQNRYLIVHSHMNALSVLPLKIAEKEGIPVRIAHCHSSSNPKEVFRTAIKNCFRPFSTKYATDLMACSKNSGIWLFGKKQWEKGRIAIINDAVDTKRFSFSSQSRSQIRQNFGIADDCYVLGTVGRLVETKNQSFLIRLLPSLLKQQSNIILLLVGDGPLIGELQSLSRRLGVSSNVFFAGAHQDSAPFYSAMDCFLFPSLYEGFGMAALEAQINGLPCVLSDKIPDDCLIANNLKKIGLRNCDKEAWLSAIVSFLGSRDKTNRNIPLFSNGKFEIANAVKDLELFYTDRLKN